MPTESKLTRGLRQLAIQSALDKGQGRTRQLRHDTRFPLMRDFESVAAGLVGDISGRGDIALRALETTSDSSMEVLDTYLTIILRAPIFLLVNEVADRYIEEQAKPEIKTSESRVNTLLRLMAEAAPETILSNEEITSVTEKVNGLTLVRSVGVIDDETTLEMALEILRGGTKRIPVRNSSTTSGTEYTYEGLVPEIGEKGIGLRYVPVVDRDYY